MEGTSGETQCLQVVTFRLGDETFAFDISKVQELIRIGEIRWVPKCPKYIKGVINLRGNLIPIVHLRERLGLEKKDSEDDKKRRIIIVELDEITVGFIVDSVLESREIPLSCIEPPPMIVMGGVESEYITGVAKLEDRLLILLNIEKILALDETKT